MAAAAHGLGIRIVIIDAPLFHIAVHIVQPPRIGLKLSHLQGDRLLEASVFLHFPELFRIRIPRIISRGSSSAADVLPLGLGGEAERAPRATGKPLAIRRSIGPGDHDHRLVIGR